MYKEDLLTPVTPEQSGYSILGKSMSASSLLNPKEIGVQFSPIVNNWFVSSISNVLGM